MEDTRKLGNEYDDSFPGWWETMAAKIEFRAVGFVEKFGVTRSVREYLEPAFSRVSADLMDEIFGSSVVRDNPNAMWRVSAGKYSTVILVLGDGRQEIKADYPLPDSLNSKDLIIWLADFVQSGLAAECGELWPVLGGRVLTPKSDGAWGYQGATDDRACPIGELSSLKW